MLGVPIQSITVTTMRAKRNTTTRQRIVARPGDRVKGRIIAAGISLGRLAEAARYSPQTLSDYLAGRNRNIHGQIEIALAFARLTGLTVTFDAFWGSLWAENAA